MLNRISTAALVLVSIILLQSQSAMAAPDCKVMDVLAANGWRLHSPGEFEKKKAWAERIIATESSDWIFDTQGLIYSPLVQHLVLVKSFDRLGTPHPLMYGDLVVTTDAETGDVLEIRWFDGRTKHAVHNGRILPCLVGFVPYAENALF